RPRRPRRAGPAPGVARQPAADAATGAPMTLPVSTSGGMLILPWWLILSGEASGGAVPIGVVGDAVDPAAPDDADPGPGQDPDGARVVVPAGAGVGVGLGRPRGGVPTGVGEDGRRLAAARV